MIGELLRDTSKYSRACLKKYQKKGSMENNRGSGRPRVTDARGDRKLYGIVKINRRQSLRDFISKLKSNEGTRVSKGTIRGRLNQEGYRRNSDYM